MVQLHTNGGAATEHHGSLRQAATFLNYDVVVVGGGAAGLGAAYGAKLAGANIIMLESEGFLGGAATARNVASYCGIYSCTKQPLKVVGGAWDPLFEELRAVDATWQHPHRHRGVFQVVDPELTKVALDRFCARFDIDYLLHAQVVAVERVNNLVVSVTVATRNMRNLVIRGSAFIDASGDCDLAARAGSAVRYGNEGSVQLGSLGTRIGGFEPEAKPSSALWQEAIREAKAADPRLAKLLHKDASVHLKLPHGDIVTFLASAAYDATNLMEITRAEREGRAQAIEYVEIFRRLPGHQNIRLVSSGPRFGTRESRHMVSQRPLVRDDVVEGREHPDSIALCGWGMEYHDEDADNWASTFDPVGGPQGVYDIPLRCLMSIDTANLFAAGRCLDGDKHANASVRVMGTAIATGQAAGVAAAQFCKSKETIVSSVQVELIRQGAILDRRQLGSPVETL